MNAYNYETQQWVEGNKATQLLRKQHEDELALLESDRGEEYARFIGAISRTQAVIQVKSILLNLPN